MGPLLCLLAPVPRHHAAVVFPVGNPGSNCSPLSGNSFVAFSFYENDPFKLCILLSSYILMYFQMYLNNNLADYRCHITFVMCQFSKISRTMLRMSAGFSYTEKTIFPFPFKLNGMWSWWQFSLRFFNQMEFHLVHNRKENCHHDHIPFNVKGNGNIVFSV